MSNSKRDMEINTLKGILTILMIVSHAMSFIGVENTVFTFYVNITTFSGFMFCFGYVSDSAYFQKDKIPYIRLFKSAIKTLGVYFMSSTLYYILVIQKFTKNILIDIFTLKSIAGYSEFLLSWSYLYVLIIILFPLLKITRKNKGVCLIICIISLLCTFINYDHLSLQLLGPLIGYKALCYFPLLQYFSYFVIGIYFKANSIIMNVSLFITCLIGSFSCLIYIWITKSEPIR